MASSRSRRLEAGPETSTFSTSCPAASIAAATALTVSALSYSASFSVSRTSDNRKLWVNATFMSVATSSKAV